MPPFCPDCPPTKPAHHASEWIQTVFLEIIDRFLEPLIPRFLKIGFNIGLMKALLIGLVKIGFLREAEIVPELKIHPRTVQIAEEAARRGLSVLALTHHRRPTNFFVLKGHGKPYYFEGLPGYTPDFVTDIDDKHSAKKRLQALGIPVPRGAVFFRPSSALRFAEELGWPLVVKPPYSSLSRHVSVNLRNPEELRRAIRVAQRISVSFLVEEFLEGFYFRATAVGDRVLAVCRRDAPATPHEGAPGWKFNLDLGGTVTDVTDTVHPDNWALFEKIATAVSHPAIGIDFIAPNISESWKNQRCGVIELNSLPAIDLHTTPIIQGTSRNLAGAILDQVFP